MSHSDEAIIPRLHRLRASPKARILFVAHGRGGGVTRHIAELSRSIAADVEVLVLRPHRWSYVHLQALGEAQPVSLWFHRDQGWEDLVATLRALGISRVHFHHVHGLPPAVLDLPARLGCPYDVTLHDYFPICPQYQLTDATGRYCGEPDEAGCARCLDALPAQWPLPIGQWRAAFEGLLAGADRVIAPSADMARRIERHFPAVKALTWPHAESPSPTRPVLKVLVPGGISTAKGMDLLEACARDAKSRDLPLHFRVLGFVARPLPPWPELPVSITGEFPEGSLGALIGLERGDAIFFPAQWPESWSYTLTGACESGLPIVATDLGAMAERLAGRTDVRIVPWRASAAAFNDALLAVAPVAPAPAAREGGTATFGDYRANYLAPLTGAARKPDPVGLKATDVAFPPEERLHGIAPDENLARPSLLELYVDAVPCGNGGSRAELARRVREADETIAAIATGDAQRRAAEAARLEAQEALERALDRAESAEAASRALSQSTSWRITAPLRALARILGRERP